MNQVNLYEQAIQHEIMLNPGLTKEEAEKIIEVDGFDFVMIALLPFLGRLSQQNLRFQYNIVKNGSKHTFKFSILNQYDDLIFSTFIDYHNDDEFADQYLKIMEPKINEFISLIERIAELSENGFDHEPTIEAEFWNLIDKINLMWWRG